MAASRPSLIDAAIDHLDGPEDEDFAGIAGFEERIAFTEGFHRSFWPCDLPRVSEMQPLIREFNLPAIPDLLIENAELVANAVTESGHFQCRQ